jgi:hypothetical protein
VWFALRSPSTRLRVADRPPTFGHSRAKLTAPAVCRAVGSAIVVYGLGSLVLEMAGVDDDD